MAKLSTSFFILGLVAVLATGRVSAQAGVTIIAPRQGEILQGVVAIRGTNEIPNFQSSELDFAYSDDNTGTWFLISTSDQPVNADVLADWDTTSITDGNYSLRLRVFLTDGNYMDLVVKGLRVRNYTAVDTPTPAPTAALPTSTPTATIVPTRYPTPTQLPENPAVITQADISTSIAYGGLGAILILIILGIYMNLRRK